MVRRHSRRYRWLPMMLTVGGLGLILLGGVVATPGRTPETASTTHVGLVADNTAATVVPNADFLRRRARILEMLDVSISQLRSNGTSFSAAAADRLDAIGMRLALASPSEPEEMEAIVADLKREATRKLAGRPGDPAPRAGIQHTSTPGRVVPIREIVITLGDIVAALRDLIRGLFPPPPYIPGLYPNAGRSVFGSTEYRLPGNNRPSFDDPSRLIAKK